MERLVIGSNRFVIVGSILYLVSLQTDSANWCENKYDFGRLGRPKSLSKRSVWIVRNAFTPDIGSEIGGKTCS